MKNSCVGIFNKKEKWKAIGVWNNQNNWNPLILYIGTSIMGLNGFTSYEENLYLYIVWKFILGS